MQYVPATAFNILAKQPKLTCGYSMFLTKIEVMFLYLAKVRP
jgi:hypothetical protein